MYVFKVGENTEVLPKNDFNSWLLLKFDVRIAVLATVPMP